MTEQGSNARAGLTTGALLASAVGLLALPSAVLAFTVQFDTGEAASPGDNAVSALSNTRSGAALSQKFPAASLARGNLYPFTPAISLTRPDRSVTVAVRLDPGSAETFSVHVPRARIGQNAEWPEAPIAPTAFSLGVARGYANFAQGLVRKDEVQTAAASAAPDLARFSIANSGKANDSRFSPRIVMDETKTAGRAPGTFAGDSDDLVDVGGSYSVTRNLEVTAGVRYSQERERLIPATDGKQDSQAVYVGTQFRF